MCKGTISHYGFELLDVCWFESMESLIGIVIAKEKSSNKLKSFIGRGKGINEVEDAMQIINWGAPFPLEAGLALFGEELNAKDIVKDNEIIECYLKLMLAVEGQKKHKIY